MKELKTGDWCYAGKLKYKSERIYLGTFNGIHLCVVGGDEDRYSSGEPFETSTWGEVHPIEDELEFTYPMWFKNENSREVYRFDNLNSAVRVSDDERFSAITPHTDESLWTQVPEPKIYYRWEKIDNTIGMILESNYISEEHSDKEEYIKDGWTKIESSRRIV